MKNENSITIYTPERIASAWQQAIIDTGFDTTPELTAIVRHYFERGFEYGYEAAATDKCDR